MMYLLLLTTYINIEVLILIALLLKTLKLLLLSFVMLIVYNLAFQIWFTDFTKFLRYAINLSEFPGCVGEGRLTISLLSIEYTTPILGLSFASSCTHRSPICIHLNIST